MNRSPHPRVMWTYITLHFHVHWPPKQVKPHAHCCNYVFDTSSTYPRFYCRCESANECLWGRALSQFLIGQHLARRGWPNDTGVFDVGIYDVGRTENSTIYHHGTKGLWCQRVVHWAKIRKGFCRYELVRWQNANYSLRNGTVRKWEHPQLLCVVLIR